MPEVDLQSALEAAITKLLEPGLVQGVIKRRLDGLTERITIRPVEIKGKRMLQVSVFDGKKTNVQNYDETGFPDVVKGLLEGQLTSVAVGTAESELLIQFSRKGRPVIHTKKRSEPVQPSLQHDRTISRPFPDGEPNPMLRAIGLMTAEGRVKADRQRKFVQINEFIRIVLESADLQNLADPPLSIIDFGCGNAYLSFALHHYLVHKLGVMTELIGVDRTEEIIHRNIERARELGEDSISFVVSGIAEYVAPRPADIVTALHACDTATDQSLAKALEYGAKLIFAAPCCHHHLQAQPGFMKAEGVHGPILRDGILRERLGDLVTDTLRALILRIAGYQVDVIEFTSPEHTAKNLLIRARKGVARDVEELIAEYQALKQEFGVTPYLEELVSNDLRAKLTGAITNK